MRNTCRCGRQRSSRLVPIRTIIQSTPGWWRCNRLAWKRAQFLGKQPRLRLSPESNRIHTAFSYKSRHKRLPKYHLTNIRFVSTTVFQLNLRKPVPPPRFLPPLGDVSGTCFDGSDALHVTQALTWSREKSPTCLILSSRANIDWLSCGFTFHSTQNR